ncbi:hypothetical protein NKG94_02855 [Micromonospora sp. M12]
MGLQLPGELVSILGILGYDWPTSDEQRLFQLGQLWVEFAPKMEAAGAAALASGSAYWENNQGEAAQAFQAWWNGSESPANALQQGIPEPHSSGPGSWSAPASSSPSRFR